MSASGDEAREALTARRDALAARAVARQLALRPELGERLDAAGRDRLAADAAQHLLYLAEAAAHDAPELFREYVAWARERQAAEDPGGVPLAEQLAALGDVLAAASLVPRHPLLSACLEASDEALSKQELSPSWIDPGARHAGLARAYLDALLAMQRRRALQRVIEAVEAGTPIPEIYLEVLQPVQREVGRLWQRNEISVAVEHYCTAATQMLMAQLYPHVIEHGASGPVVVTSGVGGELHEVGIRMVSDLLEIDGWQSLYLGSNVPVSDVVAAVAEHRAALLALSVTLPLHVTEVATAIAKVRAHPACEQIGILVGGPPFLASPSLWKRVGADGTAPDAAIAVEAAQRWKAPPR